MSLATNYFTRNDLNNLERTIKELPTYDVERVRCVAARCAVRYSQARKGTLSLSQDLLGSGKVREDVYYAVLNTLLSRIEDCLDAIADRMEVLGH